MQVGIIKLIQENEHPAPPGHPENPRRMKAAVDYVSRSDISGDLVDVVPGEVDSSAIGRIHDERYLNLVEAVSSRGGGYLDGDTYASPGSFEAARATASAAIAAVGEMMAGRFKRMFLAGRPPGHHAESNRGMGFCIINNAAVAAETLIGNHNLKRVAVVDWDVHHGNATQHSFYERSDVYYVSLHRYPFYPGSGASVERGSGEGDGYTLNIPLPGGTAYEKYLDEFTEKVVPALEQYRPEFMIISCGFDAHLDDPLGGMGMTEDAFGEMTRMLAELSDKHSEGRILSVFEGGYDPTANSLCLYHHLKELQKD
ncbi:MAG: histone deacetylase [Candidatus Zixiibacteriota bacterium]|nr:MAG: histone deacetylase [candidate division Zixibacteria bacterium]